MQGVVAHLLPQWRSQTDEDYLNLLTTFGDKTNSRIISVLLHMSLAHSDGPSLSADQPATNRFPPHVPRPHVGAANPPGSEFNSN